MNRKPHLHRASLRGLLALGALLLAGVSAAANAPAGLAPAIGPACVVRNDQPTRQVEIDQLIAPRRGRSKFSTRPAERRAIEGD